MKIVKLKDLDLALDALDTMYPSYMTRRGTKSIQFPTLYYSTVYGYTKTSAKIRIVNVDTNVVTHIEVPANNYFTFPLGNAKVQSVETSEPLYMIYRTGFKGMKSFGEVEEKGRLTYIDGCSDSILVSPPRKGDASLNYLYFPAGVNQSFHTHPSIRMGIVLEGSGFASLSDTETSAWKSSEIKLEAGDMFLLDENELHRFRTTSSSMKIIAYHPETDYGPTDENHAMINRTYLKK